MSVDERTRTLLALVDEYRESRCRDILGSAEGEARRIVGDALRAARARVRTAIAAERAGLAARVASAEAQLATHRRQAQQRRAAALAAEAWRHLPAALAERWGEAGSRRFWVETYLARAVATLPRSEWEIRHPPGWPAAERARAWAWLAERGVAAPRAVADERIAAGFRVRAGHNLLDATAEGLAADRHGIEGRLLHHFEEGARP